MQERYITPTSLSFFLIGPRGTGKSTWLKKTYPNAIYIDLLHPETLQNYLAKPERLIAILEAQTSPQTVIIDEIQKQPELLNVVHLLIERKKGHQFILTGSSARKLKQEGVNLLAGRALLKNMFPFYARELGDKFHLNRNLKIGMLPVVNDATEGENVLNSYVGIYLKEEVQAEGIVRDLGNFARFLETISFSHGSLINIANISRESQISRKVVSNYLLILNDLLLSFHIHVFSRKAKRALSSQAKFYFFDSGVYNSLKPKMIFDVESENQGAALEGLVAQHLNAWCKSQKETHNLNFWRTQSKLEVDFIVSGPTCFLAIEVKNSKAVHSKDLRGLKTFIEDYPEAKAILLYRGTEAQKIKNILCLPVDKYLMKIHPEEGLPHSL